MLRGFFGGFFGCCFFFLLYMELYFQFIKYITVYFLKLIFSLKISICFAYSFNMSSPRCILMSFIFGILILQIINGENCAEKFTPWNADVGGNAVFLDRHRLNCGASSDVLRRFKLERSGNKIRYKYTCCNLPKATCSFRKVKNSYTVDGGGNSVYLDRQHVSCGARGLLNEFWLRKYSGSGKYRYQYYCCDLSSQSSLHCYDDATLFTMVSFSQNTKHIAFVGDFNSRTSNLTKHIAFVGDFNSRTSNLTWWRID